MSKKKKQESKKARSITRSTLENHRRLRKTLLPPLSTVPRIQPSSWINERLPDMLWAALLISELPRPKAIHVFRQLGKYMARFRDSDPLFGDVRHTALSKLEPSVLDGVLKTLTSEHEYRVALRPLLLLRHLPARERWESALGVASCDTNWELLMTSVAKTLDHQSQEATDCRWVRVLCMLTAGCLKLPSKELVKELIYYPTYGDMRSVRPSIRALEISFSSEVSQSQLDWADKFWSQCLADTPCWPIDLSAGSVTPIVGTSQARLNEVYGLLVEHSDRTTGTSAVDPRHDTVFGIALYTLSLVRELLHVGGSEAIGGRITLRTIAECFITLAYLAKKDTLDLWRSYRVFGAGQAKLTSLIIDQLEQPPRFVELETLSHLANEDIWEEFLKIELGHWAKADLRRLSEEAGVKDEYDRYYPWTSTFAHGHWGAVRDAVYDICGNPLHRLHRIPRTSARALPDVVPDACRLADRILELVSTCYPDFPHRITIEST